MLKFKGSFISTVSIFFFLVFGFLLFIGIKGILGQFIISAQTDFKINLKADDRGTEIVSFLNAEKNGIKNIEILGYFDASNSTDLSGVEKSLEKMKSVGGKNFTLNVLNKKRFGEGANGDKVEVDIPLPGGKIGGLELDFMKGFTEVLPLVFCIAIAIAAVYTYGVAAGVNEIAVKNIVIEKDLYLLGNSLNYAKLFLDTSLKYSTFQALFDLGNFNSTLPTKEEFQSRLSEKIKENLNKYTEKAVVFFDNDHKVGLPKYNNVEALFENKTIQIQASGDKIIAAQNNPTEKINLGKDSELSFEIEYGLFDDATNFVKGKFLENELNGLIATLPTSGELKLFGCENKDKEISDIDVFNSLKGSSYFSIDESSDVVLAQITERANEFVSAQSTNKTKWGFSILGNPSKNLIANCQVKKDNMCDSNQTKSYTYTKTCGFGYSYQFNSSIQLTDLKNTYPVESGLLVDKKINLEHLKLKFVQSIDLDSNSVI